MDEEALKKRSGTVLQMLKMDIFLKAELQKMFLTSFKRQAILIVCCTSALIGWDYWNANNNDDVVLLKQLKENRKVLIREREVLQKQIDSFNELLKKTHK